MGDITIKLMSNWTDKELRSAIEVYLLMLDKLKNKEKFTKSALYKELAKKHNRTPSAFEYRMSNISYVFALHGRQWLKGLSPLSHVGHNVVSRIESILSELENRPVNYSVLVESQVNQLLSKMEIKEPKGSYSPRKLSAKRIVYERDPLVKAWVLNNAKGVCELCKKNAPFKAINGHDFLEVHHPIRLADGGPDKIENAVALCPNCHREIHYGINKEKLLGYIYSSISRLKKN